MTNGVVIRKYKATGNETKMSLDLAAGEIFRSGGTKFKQEAEKRLIERGQVETKIAVYEYVPKITEN